MGFAVTLLVERYGILFDESNRTDAFASALLLDLPGYKVREALLEHFPKSMIGEY